MLSIELSAKYDKNMFVWSVDLKEYIQQNLYKIKMRWFEGKRISIQNCLLVENVNKMVN